ncbi:hypothetical protein BU23DRAFT_180340 [Bimuria novae-zelandiae CBS 107.79]|uniref:Uncharacterized protein n=1 Tax=Bimuria novae-zelandiae CBS 107.79 TaxID=1447943 RepID=A0A6A5VDQ9_9PLEO|nr:hypothetical protein BU23DRAFT_180340 [Bimuria novae-zelandiae CBS 107.79]
MKRVMLPREVPSQNTQSPEKLVNTSSGGTTPMRALDQHPLDGANGDNEDNSTKMMTLPLLDGKTIRVPTYPTKTGAIPMLGRNLIPTTPAHKRKASKHTASTATGTPDQKRSKPLLPSSSAVESVAPSPAGSQAQKPKIPMVLHAAALEERPPATQNHDANVRKKVPKITRPRAKNGMAVITDFMEKHVKSV